MGKGKVKKWNENHEFANVHQPPLQEIIKGGEYKKGKWGEEVFGNDHPIVLELGCGKGEYTVGLASRFPDKNFIGIDVKGHRFWRGAKTSMESGTNNVAFLRTRIEFIDHFFQNNEIDEIWLTFSDPQPKDRKGTKRITSPVFIERYKKFLKPGGFIHVKTDNKLLYSLSLEEYLNVGYEILESTNDLYGEYLEQQKPEVAEILQIQTHYEKLFIDYTKTINYIKIKV